MSSLRDIALSPTALPNVSCARSEWLADKSWRDDRELFVLLSQFLDEYNDRPHQGLAIPGLSPNEFAKRILLM